MRTIRALTTALALVAALPVVVAAQHGRQFKDAWFWGIKGGGFAFADSGGQYKTAPVGGVEWLITRTHGGLYVAASQAFLNTQTMFFADPSAPDTVLRAIDIKNVRKLDIALMAFPGTHLRMHPYAGVGFTLLQAASATGRGPFTNQESFDATQAQIEQSKVGFSPLLMVGTQYRLRLVSIFAQGMMSPAQKNFIMYNGRPVNLTYEVGLRYNVGTSIAKE